MTTHGAIRFLYQSRLTILICLSIVLSAHIGCSGNETPSEPEPPSTSSAGDDAPTVASENPPSETSAVDDFAPGVTRTADPLTLVQARDELQGIRDQILKQNGLTPDIVAQIADLYRRFPLDGQVRDLLIRGYQQFQNWQGLKTVLSAIPAEQRTLAQQLQLADAMARMQEYEEAFQLLNPLVESNPSNIELAGLTAESAFYTERYDRAAELLDAHWQEFVSAGDVRADYQRGVIYLNNGDYDKAIELLSALVGEMRAPSHAAAHEALGKALEAKGENESAQQHIEAARVIRAEYKRPEHVERHLLELSQMLGASFKAGRYVECEKYIADILPFTEGQERAFIFQVQAAVFDAQGKAEQARVALRMAQEEAAKAAAEQGGAIPPGSAKP